LDLAALELLLVQRRVDAILAQQGAVGTGFHDASSFDDVDEVGVDDGGRAMAMVVRDPMTASRAFSTSRSLAVSIAEGASSRIRMRGSCRRSTSPSATPSSLLRSFPGTVAT